MRCAKGNEKGIKTCHKKKNQQNTKEGSKRGKEGQNTARIYRQQLTKWQQKFFFLSVITSNVNG